MLLVFLPSPPSTVLLCSPLSAPPAHPPAPHLFSQILLRLLLLLFLTAGPQPFPSVSMNYFQFMARAYLPPPGKPLFIYPQTAENER